jgi:HAD superfamily hydrolase (TIGR01509 family)
VNEIKLAIFDLDGVLIDSKNIHFRALNEALSTHGPEFQITESEHILKYDGLSTKRKLEILHKEKGLPFASFQQIWEIKQIKTTEMLYDLKPDYELINFLKFIQDKNINIAVASNSIRATINIVLKNLGILNFFSLIMSNEDVKYPKPHPEIFWKTIIHFGLLPEQVLIFEDSQIGRIAAQRSGANLIPIDSRKDLTIGKIMNINNSTSNISSMSLPWKSDTLNILIPMAGAGSRFENAGYSFPKPLIEVHGKPMIQVIVENLNIDAKFIYIVRKEHYDKYNLEYLLKLLTPNCEILITNEVTEGAACTTLLAKNLINNEKSLLIANSDQFIEWNSSETIYSFMSEGIDGGIVTFNSTHPKWSYARTNDEGIVLEVAEKKPISNLATVGVYFWRKGLDYVKYAENMIEKNIRTNSEFYVCPVYNQAIEDGKKIKIKNIDKMWGLGTPEDLKYFLETYKGSHS